MQRGLFISFEGSEGCGKSTQIERLAARLKNAGLQVLLTREPGGTEIGEAIKQLLQFSPAGKKMTAETELLLFTASRAQLVREVIEPALRSGKTVIADRFLDSTTVYQGVARQLDAASVKLINDFVVGSCRPDLTFVLDLDPAAARERLMRRVRPVGLLDRMEEQPAQFYQDVRDGYLQLAAAEPERAFVLDGSRPAEQIERDIWQRLQEKFHEFFKSRRI